jgi:DNA-binding GntR family transcriptional regulator
MPRKHQHPHSLAEQAYAKILDQILKGEYPLGAVLSRRRIGLELGMSFLPISEAIKRLEQEGLVESRPRVGTRVRIPTPQDVRDRHIIREALEAQSARLFAEKASGDERAEVRAMAEHLDELMNQRTGADDTESLFATQMYHLSFHMRIAECAGCAPLCEMLAKNQVLIFNWLYDRAADHRTGPRWHRQLADKLTGTDPDVAEAAMRAHVRHGIEEIQAEIVRRFGSSAASLDGIRRPRTPAPSKPGAWRMKAGAAR